MSHGAMPGMAEVVAATLVELAKKPHPHSFERAGMSLLAKSS